MLSVGAKAKALANPTPFRITSDKNGELWLVFGTDSGFESTTTIYYNRITAVFKK